MEMGILLPQGWVEVFDDRVGGSLAVFQGVSDGLPLDVGVGLHRSADLGVLIELESQAGRRHLCHLHHIMMIAPSAARRGAHPTA
jgi:hypothetical protein